MDDFVVFICTHGRPNSQHTYNTLKKCRYSGKIILVLDDTDSTLQQYIDIYGVDMLRVFNKNHYINSSFDNGDNKPHYKCILYAKRAVEDIASSMGLKYFAIADDDITDFVIRYPNKGKLTTYPITNFDFILDSYVDILQPSVACVGFGYAKSYFKGANTFEYTTLSNRSLPYQFLIRNSAVKVNWVSWFGEDDITELQSSLLGSVWLSIPHVMQVMKPIGSVDSVGGMVETYRDFDEFTRKFNIFKYCPQRTYFMCRKNKMYLAHKTNSCFPKIISEVYKK